MSDPELVIFDCDGVLVDSEIIAARVEAGLITAAGFPIEAEELAERYAGLTFKDILMEIEREAAIPFQASLLGEAERLVDKRLSSEVRATEGAREAVASVPYPKCVCSNSSKHRIEAMLGRTGILPLFGGNIFSAKEPPVEKPKPAPDVFLHGAQAMGARPEACFVVEDSVHGVHAAKAAGMRAIGFTGNSHSYPGLADALTDAGAETVINRWPDFLPVLAALSDWRD